MKRAILTLAVLLALPLVFAGVAQANSHYWKIEMSDPTAADQERTFNIEYTALSTRADDVISVELTQDGSLINTDQTAPGGDSGEFRVTVDEDGTYVYRLIATSSADDGSEVQSTARAVTVTTPEDDQPPVIESTPELTPEEEAALLAQGNTLGAAAVTDVDGDGEDTDGVVGDEAGVTENGDDEDGEVLGAGDEADDAAERSIVLSILGVLAVLALLYWYFFYRKGNVNPLNRE